MSVNPEIAHIARRWMFKGDNHLEAVRVLLADAGCPHDIACYHCQQGAEMYIKALLTVAGIASPKTRDIDHLHSLLPAGRRLPIASTDLNYLSPYGIDCWWEPDRAQAERAFEIVKNVREKTLAALSRNPAAW